MKNAQKSLRFNNKYTKLFAKSIKTLFIFKIICYNVKETLFIQLQFKTRGAVLIDFFEKVAYNKPMNSLL